MRIVKYLISWSYVLNPIGSQIEKFETIDRSYDLGTQLESSYRVLSVVYLCDLPETYGVIILVL